MDDCFIRVHQSLNSGIIKATVLSLSSLIQTNSLIFYFNFPEAI